MADTERRAEIRVALDAWRTRATGRRITVPDLTERFNQVTAGPALTTNEFGRLLASIGIRSTPDKGKRWVRVLDAAGDYLPPWLEIFASAEAIPTPAPEVAGTVAYAPGTLLRVTEDGGLEVVSVPQTVPVRPSSKRRTVLVRAEDPAPATEAVSDDGLETMTKAQLREIMVATGLKFVHNNRRFLIDSIRAHRNGGPQPPGYYQTAKRSSFHLPYGPGRAPVPAPEPETVAVEPVSTPAPEAPQDGGEDEVEKLERELREVMEPREVPKAALNSLQHRYGLRYPAGSTKAHFVLVLPRFLAKIDVGVSEVRDFLAEFQRRATTRAEPVAAPAAEPSDNGTSPDSGGGTLASDDALRALHAKLSGGKAV